MLPNVAFSLVPMPLTMITTEMPAAMRPYSPPTDHLTDKLRHEIAPKLPDSVQRTQRANSTDQNKKRQTAPLAQDIHRHFYGSARPMIDWPEVGAVFLRCEYTVRNPFAANRH